MGFKSKVGKGKIHKKNILGHLAQGRTAQRVPVSDSGIEAPEIIPIYCHVVSVSNITLGSATTEIDGVTLTGGEIVLCIGQTDANENGLWVASTTDDWERANTKIKGGQLYYVAFGDVHADAVFKNTNEDVNVLPDEGGDITYQIVDALPEQTLFVSPSFVGYGAPFFSEILKARSYAQNNDGAFTIVVYPGTYTESGWVYLRGSTVKHIHFIDAVTDGISFNFDGSYADGELSITGNGRLTGSAYFGVNTASVRPDGEYYPYLLEADEITMTPHFNLHLFHCFNSGHKLTIRCNTIHSLGRGFNQSGSAQQETYVYATVFKSEERNIRIADGQFYAEVYRLQSASQYALEVSGVDTSVVVHSHSIETLNGTSYDGCVINEDGYLRVHSNIIKALNCPCVKVNGGVETTLVCDELKIENGGSYPLLDVDTTGVVHVNGTHFENKVNDVNAHGIEITGGAPVINIMTATFDLANASAYAIKRSSGGGAVVSNGVYLDNPVDTGFSTYGVYTNFVNTGIAKANPTFPLHVAGAVGVGSFRGAHGYPSHALDYTANVYHFTSGTNLSVTQLPPASESAGMWYFLSATTTGNIYTLTPDGADLMNGSNSGHLWGDTQPVIVWCDGTEWFAWLQEEL